MKKLKIALLSTSLLTLGLINQDYIPTPTISTAYAQSFDRQATRAALLRDTPMTAAQFDQLTDQNLQDAKVRTEQLNPTGGDIGHYYNVIVMDYPQVFKAESDRMRNAVVAASDFSLADLAAVEDWQLFQIEFMVWQNNNQVEDFAEVARRIQTDLKVYPSQVNVGTDFQALRDTLIRDTPITSGQLAQLSDQNLKDAQVRLQQLNPHGGDIGHYYNVLVTDYPQVFKAESDRMRNAIVAASDFTLEDLKAVADAPLFHIEFMVWMDNNQTENFAEVARRIQTELKVYPSQSSQTTTVSASPIKNADLTYDYIRSKMLSETPMTPSQFNSFTEATMRQAVNNSNQPGIAYETLVKQYPDVFASEVNRIKSALIHTHGLNNEDVTNFDNLKLLWEEFYIWQNNQQVEDHAKLANRLVQAYGVRRQPATSQAPAKQDQINRLPNTGEGGNYLIMGLGALLLIAGAGLVLKGKRKV